MTKATLTSIPNETLVYHIAPCLERDDLISLLTTSQRLREEISVAFTHIIPLPIHENSLYLDTTTDLLTALIHARASPTFPESLSSVFVTICSVHAMFLLIQLLKDIPGGFRIEKAYLDFTSKEPFDVTDVQSIFQLLSFTQPDFLCIAGLNVVGSTMSRWNYPEVSSYTTVHITSSMVLSAPFREFFRFLRAGPMKSLYMLTFLPSEAPFDCSNFLESIDFPHLENLEIRGQYTPAAVTRLVHKSPFLQRFELWENCTNSVLPSRRLKSVTRLDLATITGHANQLANILPQLHMPYLQVLQILPDRYSRDRRFVTAKYCHRVSLCLKHAKPSHLALVFPKSASSSKMRKLDTSQFDQVKYLSLGGLCHYPVKQAREWIIRILERLPALRELAFLDVAQHRETLILRKAIQHWTLETGSNIRIELSRKDEL